jgi:GWxTD domain-containing protein
VRDLNGPTSASDILFVQKRVKDEKGTRVIPNITRNVASETSGFGIYYELYTDHPKTVTIKYSIKDAKDDELFSTEETKDVLENRNQIFDSISVKNLSIGDYRLSVKVSDLNGNVLSETSKGFVSQWVGVPNTMEDLKKSVEQMVYIAEPNELDYIEEAETQEEMAKRFQQFWKSKDPNPQTEDNIVFDEYYRRVAYANANFKHYREGWRTDMGMIYITLGPPSYVERHPFDSDSKPYEVWDYYDINQRFIFIDNTGFGDYRLYNPTYGNWFKYRQ